MLKLKRRRLLQGLCVTAIAFCISLSVSSGDAVWAAPDEDRVQSEQTDGSSDAGKELMVWDIDDGSIYITENGYYTDDKTTEILYDGVYKITGTAKSEAGVHVLSGEHTIILDNLILDQRPYKDCCPLSISGTSAVRLNINGICRLLAGSGNSGIDVRDSASLKLAAYGDGMIDIEAYPVVSQDCVYGGEAIAVSEDASVEYPLTSSVSYMAYRSRGHAGCRLSDCEACMQDFICMFAGNGVDEQSPIAVYDGQIELTIRYRIADHVHVPGAAADCTGAQYCVECGAQIAPIASHVPGEKADCTHDQYCLVCGQILTEAYGHQGIWVVSGYSEDGSVRYENMTCEICGETMYREVYTGEN